MTMPLLTVSGDAPPPPAAPLHEMVEIRLRGPDDFWIEWDVDLGDGRRDHRSAQVDPAVAVQIFKLPNFQAGLQMAADNTLSKVKP